MLCFDGRGNGRSDRPRDPEAYRPQLFAEDAGAVLDVAGSDRVVVVGASFSGLTGLLVAVLDPRVEGGIFIGPAYPLAEPWPAWTLQRFREPLDSYEGWAKYNVHYWREHHEDFARLWMEACLPERHSTRGIEYMLEMALETDGETLAATLGPDAGQATMREVLEALQSRLEAAARGLGKPVLVIQGRQDHVTPWEWGAALAERYGRRAADARARRPRAGWALAG